MCVMPDQGQRDDIMGSVSHHALVRKQLLFNMLIAADCRCVAFGLISVMH